ncbi:MAG: hypothetical protein U5R31_11270 [Acidimicrobiia bacterium]|nr:hypothetical protein [Acidimicrobiia bacterium]
MPRRPAYWKLRIIPATSRSGERLMRRSLVDLDGSPSKSMITKSRPARSTWPRWRSPWIRIRIASMDRSRIGSRTACRSSPRPTTASAASRASSGTRSRLLSEQL